MTDRTQAGVGTRSCLVIIDVQKGVFTRKQSVFAAEDLVKALVRLVDAATNRHMLVVLTQHRNRTFLEPGSEGWEIVDEVRAVASTAVIVPKTRPSIFHDTGLAHLLAAAGIGQLFVAGLLSNGCVRDSCIDGLQRGFDVTLVSDAHSTLYRNAASIVEAVNTEVAGCGAALVTVEALLGCGVAPPPVHPHPSRAERVVMPPGRRARS